MYQLLLVLLCSLLAQFVKGTGPDKILVLGGNGYIGSEVVLKLLESGYDVACVNRGNSYWDSHERINPLVKRIHCDRNKGLSNCAELKARTSPLDYYKAIVDLSAYMPQNLNDSLEYFDKRFGLYIYISTDSVYEVCKRPSHGNLLKEEDSQRPESKKEQEQLNAYDNYGHRKLEGEDVLIDYHNRTASPYVIFRLPDVLGPRDSTNRWWFYQLWIQFFSSIQTPIMVPANIINLKTSYIYVKDVAKAIDLAVKGNGTVWNDIYNLGYDKPMTLGKLLHEIQMELNVDHIEHDNDDSPSSFYIYPSVNFGAMDVSKAHKKLGWVPTPWHLALSETVAFYTEAIWKFPLQRNIIIDSMYTQILPSQRREKFQDQVTKFIENLKRSSKIPNTEL